MAVLGKELSTVRNQIGSMLGKTGCINVSDLILWALRAGVVELYQNDDEN